MKIFLPKKYLLFGDIDGSVVRSDEEVTETNLIGKVLSGERREWSRWGTMCPVSAPENVQGDFSCAAMYQNAIYLMSCKENLELFMASPQKYVCAVPIVNPKMKLLVVSPVLGGGETAESM